MKKKEVPQDEGLNEGRFEDVCYALDDNGNYVAVLSKGWNPKTDALLQAWEVIHEKTEQARQRVQRVCTGDNRLHVEVGAPRVVAAGVPQGQAC